MRYGFLIAIHVLVLLTAILLLLLWMIPPKKKTIVLVISSVPLSVYDVIIVSMTVLLKKGYVRGDVVAVECPILPHGKSTTLFMRIFPNCRSFRRKQPSRRGQARIRIDPSEMAHHALSFPVDEWSSLFFSHRLRLRQNTLNVVVLDCGDYHAQVIAVLSSLSWVRIHLSPITERSMADADCLLGSSELDHQMHMKPGGVVMEFTEDDRSSRYHALAIAMRHCYLVFSHGRLSHPLLQQYQGTTAPMDGEFKNQLTHVMNYLRSMYLH